jgi:hypothetical protein
VKRSGHMVILIALVLAGAALAQDAATVTIPPPAAANPTLGWTLLIVWLAMVGFVLWRDFPRFFSGGASAIDESDDQSWLGRVLPLVRLRQNASWFPLPLTRRDEAIVVYPAELIRIRKRRKQRIDAAYRLDGSEDLKKTKGIKVKRVIPIAMVEKVMFKKPWIRGFFLNLIRMKIHSAKGTQKMYIRGCDLPNLLRALEILLPGKVVVPPTARHKWWKQKKSTQDLSKRRPLRSRPLALALKLVAVALIGASLWYLWGSPFLVVVYFVLVGLLQIANGLWERDPSKLLGSDPRRPILYLRSFLDDRETSLHPESSFSALVGLDPPFYELEAYRDARFYGFLRAVVRSLSNHHPVRLLKLMIDRPLDTSEEQMASFFARYGMFVAIGKPGEQFATTGAARMYVGNQEWQDVVKHLLRDSQVVLLQPSSTEGVWWEVEQTIRMAEPSRVLMCMVNYRGRQNDFEIFRLRLEKFLPSGVQVPRGIGNNPYVTFLYFDNQWQPHELRLVYYSRLLWPVRLRAVNLLRTLKPFLQGCRLVDDNGKMLPPADRQLGASAGS